MEPNVVGGSRRPDGTLRKQIKVRPGYTPPEEVGKYTVERAERFKQPIGIPGLAPKPVQSIKTKPKSSTTKTSSDVKALDTIKADAVKSKRSEPNQETNVQQDKEEPMTEKKLRAVQKKLRQIADLKEKLGNGQALNPEQLAKLETEAALNEQLKQLQLE